MVCNWRTFNVTVNQEVNVSWYLNGLFLFTNESITEANCTLHAEVEGGHSEYVHIWSNGIDKNASWAGYSGDWHNITFGSPFKLEAGKTYDYEITTGSYPQIIHESSKEVIGGTINCTTFVDANGKEYNNWIPAIRLE
jgi:hypothetical protein